MVSKPSWRILKIILVSPPFPNLFKIFMIIIVKYRLNDTFQSQVRIHKVPCFVARIQSFEKLSFLKPFSKLNEGGKYIYDLSLVTLQFSFIFIWIFFFFFCSFSICFAFLKNIDTGAILASGLLKEWIGNDDPEKKKVFKNVCQINFKQQKIMLEKIKAKIFFNFSINQCKNKIIFCSLNFIWQTVLNIFFFPGLCLLILSFQTSDASFFPGFGPQICFSWPRLQFVFTSPGLQFNFPGPDLFGKF